MTETTALPAPTTTRPVYVESKNLSVIALVLGIASVLLGYRREPGARAMAVWGIVLGAVMTFGWLVVGFLGVLFAGPFFLFGLF